MLAIKAARAYTGRPKIAKFEGAYHGTYDWAQVSEGSSAATWGDAGRPASVIEPGTPASVANEVIVLPWNDFATSRELIRQNRDHLAAVLVDALPAAIGLIAPVAGFLELLREETESAGALLISDEVMSFRLSYRGAMHQYGIHPDLTALGKIIGGGFPVGAVAGSRAVMSVFDHTGDLKVHHGGTYNANPITMVAGFETMRQLTSDVFERLNGMGDYLRQRLARMLGDRALPARITGQGSLFAAHLVDHELVDFRSLSGFSRSNPAYEELCHELLARGIIISPRGVFGCLSTPMSEAELDALVDALDRSLTALNY
jgi:glutamate-1-semialdehyde 2,1-aminomutase